MTQVQHALRDILEDAVVFNDGDWVESKDQDPDGDVRLIQLADVGDGCYINKSNRFMTSTRAKALRCTFLEPGDLLVARMPDPLGRCCVFPGDEKPCVTVVDICVIRPSVEKVFPRWLMHCLNAPITRHRISGYVTGTTRQRISRGNLGKVMVPLPPLPEQKRIAEILDRAEALRAQRRAALALLDELTQSIFLDMFGDPVSNPMGFPIRALREFYINGKDGTKCGPFGSALKRNEFVEEGIPVWNMDNIAPTGHMVLPFRMWITEHKYKKLESYAVRDGDVLVSRAGTVGKMCVAILGAESSSIISTNLIRVRFGPQLLPIFFVSLMTLCKNRIGRLKTGADGAFTHMSTGILDSLRFPYPSIELQKLFASRLDSLEGEKIKMGGQLTELDSLFASLQHRAFRGEL